MSHLNELHEKFASKGLTIVGVASESESKTDPWIEETGAEYAYAFDHSGKLMRAVGARGYPSAVLVDPTGNIAFLGHPAKITDAMVEAATKGALAAPIYEWPDACKKVAKAVKKGKLGDAVKNLEAIEADHPEIAASVRGMVKGRVESLEGAVEAQNWLRVETLGEDLEKSLGKLPESERVGEILDALKKDKEAQEILKAQKKVAKLLAGSPTGSKADRAKKELAKIRDAYEGTAAERDARAGLESLKKK